MVSATTTGTAATSISCDWVSQVAPSGPRVTMTAAGPSASSRFAPVIGSAPSYSAAMSSSLAFTMSLSDATSSTRSTSSGPVPVTAGRALTS